MGALDREAIRAAVQAKLEQRLGVIDDLADAKDGIGVAEEALRAARQRVLEASALYASTYKAALGAGWSSKELKESGLPAPQRERTDGKTARPARRAKSENTDAEEAARVS